MRKGLLWASAATLCLAGTTVANAVTIDVSSGVDYSSGAGFNSNSYTFDLPTGFLNPVLSITNFDADDRAVLQLNGTIVANTGIFGPGDGQPPILGQMQLTSGGPNDPFSFTHGNNATTFASVTTGFLAGTNTLTIIVNDTFNGIFGNTGTTAGPSAYSLTAAVTFDVAQNGAIPEPSTWAMMLLGFGAVGYTIRRRQRKTVALQTA